MVKASGPVDGNVGRPVDEGSSGLKRGVGVVRTKVVDAFEDGTVVEYADFKFIAAGFQRGKLVGRDPLQKGDVVLL